MTLEQLMRAKEAQPFEPFEICTADGQRIPVPHPDSLFVPPNDQRTFVVAHDDGTVQVVDLLLGSTLTLGNGRRRRRKPR